MKRSLLFATSFLISLIALAQPSRPTADTSWKKVYRPSAEKINDLVNTRLDAKFDFSKSYMYGKVWITLKPHFYPTDSLSLDAKGMDIHKVAIVKGTSQTPLKYEYDGWILNIKLDRTYKGGEDYVVFID
jgi:aminopeptidase N